MPRRSGTHHAAGRFIAEKEPNDGFAKAQVVASGNTIAGTIHKARDVDVYRLGMRAGQTLTAEVTAARRGSLLDALLMVFDEGGNLVATADDTPQSRDARVVLKAARDGDYFVTLLDAHDHGGPVYAYQLSLKAK